MTEELNPIGPIKQTGVLTLEQKEQVLSRREQSVKLRAMGFSIAEIARRTGVSWATANSDLNKHLRALARMSTTIEHRQHLAEIYLRSILLAERVIADLGEREFEGAKIPARTDVEAGELRLKAIDRIQKAAESLMRLYGLVGPNVVIPTIPLRAGGISFEGIRPGDIDVDKVRELREKFLEFMGSIKQPDVQPVDADFEMTEEKEPGPDADSQNGTNGHST